MLQLENQKYPYCNLRQNENLLLAACSRSLAELDKIAYFDISCYDSHR